MYHGSFDLFPIGNGRLALVVELILHRRVRESSFALRLNFLTSVSFRSTGLFIFAYSIFYFYFRSNMSGFLQASFFFGYVGIVSYLFFIMLGTVGFFSSLIFVRKIYGNLHVE